MLTGIGYDYPEHTWELPFAEMEPQLALMAITQSGPWQQMTSGRMGNIRVGWHHRLPGLGAGNHKGNQLREGRGRIWGRCRVAQRSHGYWTLDAADKPGTDLDVSTCIISHPRSSSEKWVVSCPFHTYFLFVWRYWILVAACKLFVGACGI